ncbi:hypothetical protein SVIOM342S_05056 [Streptomyces violaceorubidus]
MSVRPAYRSPSVSAATTTSATSRTSTNGSRTSPAGNTSSPRRSSAASGPSLKFCANQARHHRPVRPRRPQRLLGGQRLVLAPRGQQHQPPHAEGERLAGEAADRLGGAGGAHVRGVDEVGGVGPAQGARPGRTVAQSNPVARDAARTVNPAAPAARATRLPVRPEVPATTTVRSFASFTAFAPSVPFVSCVMRTSQLPSAAGGHRRAAHPHAPASTLPPWTLSPACWKAPVRGARS